MTNMCLIESPNNLETRHICLIESRKSYQQMNQRNTKVPSSLRVNNLEILIKNTLKVL